MTEPDDHSLFSAAVSDVNRMKNNDKVYVRPKVNKERPRLSPADILSAEPVIPLSLLTEPLFRAEGVQPGVMEKLRRGNYRLDGSLSLLRQNPEQAREALFHFIKEITARDGRNILIIHGKSQYESGQANIIRSYLVQWLPLLPEVRAFCVASRRHGGSGALYVSLAKSALQQRSNSEEYGGRGR